MRRLFFIVICFFSCIAFAGADDSGRERRDSCPTVNFSPKRRQVTEHQPAVHFYPQVRKPDRSYTRNFEAKEDAEETGPQVRPRRKNRKTASPLHTWRQRSFYKKSGPFQALQRFDKKLQKECW